MAENQTASPDRLRSLAGGLLISLAALAAYSNSFSAPFLFDDDGSILHNRSLRHLRSMGAVLSPPHDTTVGGRPLLNLTLAVNYAIGGTSVWSYHALNLAIHILAGLTLFGILRRTLARLGRAPEHAFRVGLAAALLWTLHPLQTEAVTYIVQRAESLMGMFYLLTLYGFVRGAEEVGPGRPALPAIRQNHKSTSFVWFGLSWLACLLGMAAKEVMVTAPLMVLAYDRIFVSGSFRRAWIERRRYYAALAATWILLGYLVLSAGGNRGGTAGFNVGVAWWAYWLTQFEAAAHYLRLSVWPHPLAFEYGTFWVHGFREVAPSALLVLALLAATLVALRRLPALGFLGLWFFGILALTSVVPGTAQMIVEHRMYLPLAAPMTLLALGLVRLAETLPRPPKLRRSAGGALGLALAAALAFGGLTFERNRDYRSELSLWEDTVAKRPNSARAQNALGGALLRLGRLPAAALHYQAAIRIDPGYADPHNNLGNILAQTGRLPEAIGQYRAALLLVPDYPAAHTNLGNALAGAGRLTEAIAHYRRALAVDPDLAETECDLGLALLRVHQPDEAVSAFEQALRIKPDFAAAEDDLGIARQYAEAEHLKK